MRPGTSLMPAGLILLAFQASAAAARPRASDGAIRRTGKLGGDEGRSLSQEASDVTTNKPRDNADDGLWIGRLFAVAHGAASSNTARASSSGQKESRYSARGRFHRKDSLPDTDDGMPQPRDQGPQGSLEGQSNKTGSDNDKENKGNGTDNTKATFRVRQVRRSGSFQGRNGLQAMLHVYAKHGIPLPPDLRFAAEANPTVNGSLQMQKRGSVMTGTAIAIPPQGTDYEFVSPVSIGTPPQTLLVDFDTGSADFWVFSTETPPASVAGQELYDANASTTAMKLVGENWSIGYGDGSGASGDVYLDRVAVGNAVVPAQAVQAAQSVSPGFTADPFSSGLLGLGQSIGNTVRPMRQKTFSDSLAPALAQPVFTANLRHGRAGDYGFGFVNAAEYTGSIQYAPVGGNSVYWQFSATGYQIGAPGAPPQTNHPYTVIADTGTTLMLLPDAGIVASYYAHVAGARRDPDWAAVLFPCASALPDFSFMIGSYKGTVPGRYINYSPVNATHCYGGIQSASGMPFGIFGDVALKAQFVVFDMGRLRIGFANKKLLS